jgi:hypothetical protein
MRVLYGLMLVRGFAKLAPARHGASTLRRHVPRIER